MAQPTIVTINRDPFARADLNRIVVKTNRGCDWCGSNHQNHLFRYGWHQDGSMGHRDGFAKGEFCCKSCYEAYHS